MCIRDRVNTKPVVVKPMPPVEVIPPSLPPPPLVSQPETSVGATALGGLANDLVLQPLPPPIRRDPKQIRVGALIWAAGYLPAFIAPLLLWPKADTADGPSALANYSLLVPLLGDVYKRQCQRTLSSGIGQMYRTVHEAGRDRERPYARSLRRLLFVVDPGQVFNVWLEHDFNAAVLALAVIRIVRTDGQHVGIPGGG